jgi:DNA-binding MarR family transcriptional regulator
VADRKELWTLAEQAMRAFMPFYLVTMRQAIEDVGVPDNWGCLNMARGCHPEPLSLERYRAMVPYSAGRRLAEILERVAQAELLERVGDEAYALTDQGLQAAEGVYEAAHRALERAEPLPPAELDQLNTLLWRVVRATLEAPEPREKWAIAGSRWTDPGDGAPGAVRMDQFLTDLLRYRDDAHIAAWRPYGVTGIAWEALTFIWRDQAHTAAALGEGLPFRGYSAPDYEAALADLAERGWISQTADGYKVTEKGAALRQEAEEATDRHCFVGLDSLTGDELEQLADLLARARDNLRLAGYGMAWDLLGELPQHLLALTREVVIPAFEAYGLNQPGLFQVLRRAYALAPNPIEVATLTATDPYSNPARYEQSTARAAEAGLTRALGNGKYEVTVRGREAWEGLNDLFYVRLGELEALPAEESGRLEGLAGRLVQASLEAPEPAEKRAALVTHAEHPAGEYAPLAKIDMHLDDLRAFRDDAHLAAWKPYGAAGAVWETLTYVWRGEARTAEALGERLGARGYSAEVYAKALADLARRGWVEERADGFAVTDSGGWLRQEAEEVTDRYFYGPWSCLSDPEVADLVGLLTRLRDNLQGMARDTGEPAAS